MPKQNKSCGSKRSFVSNSLEAMKADGARLTKTRKAVLDCLSNTKKPLTPNEIMNAINSLKGSSIQIDLVSVYRNLKYMTELSLVHQVGLDGGYVPCGHSQCGSKTHILTLCTSCHDTAEIHMPNSSSLSLLEFLNETIGFESDPHAIEIKGLCSNCRN